MKLRRRPGTDRAARRCKRGSPAASLAGVRSGGMTQSRSRGFLRTIPCVAADVLRFPSFIFRPPAQLAAENLFLRKHFALYLERQIKPRRADGATRLTLIALSRPIPRSRGFPHSRDLTN